VGEEAKEMVYTATNLIFIAAVLFVALMFFGLRSDYANTVAERQVAEKRIEEQNYFKAYDSMQVTGYDVMGAITAYALDVPMYVTGAYNYMNSTTIQNRLYSAETRMTNPDWFKLSLAADPTQDTAGMQSIYRKESVYYAILTYDGDTPNQLAKDMGLDTATGAVNISGRNAGAYNTSIANKILWLSTKYNTARPKGQNGYSVSGILFICIDAQGAPVIPYRQVSIY